MQSHTIRSPQDYRQALQKLAEAGKGGGASEDYAALIEAIRHYESTAPQEALDALKGEREAFRSTDADSASAKVSYY